MKENWKVEVACRMPLSFFMLETIPKMIEHGYATCIDETSVHILITQKHFGICRVILEYLSFGLRYGEEKVTE